MDSRPNLETKKKNGFFQKLCWTQRSTKDNKGKFEKRQSVTKTKKISTKDSVRPCETEPGLENEMEIQCHEYSERHRRHKHHHRHTKRHRTEKPVTCCEHCPRYQETNPPKCCTQKCSDKRLPYSVADKLPKPSDKETREPRMEVVNDNLTKKDMVSNSRPTTKSKKKNGYYQKLGRILCCNRVNKKKIKKNPNNHPVKEMNKISSGHSAKPEKIEPNLTNKTESLSQNSSECRHHHTCQRIQHHSKHHKLVTQSEINSRAKYFWLWFPCMFSNENSFTNTTKSVDYCEHSLRSQETKPTQFYPQKRSDKGLPTSVSDNPPRPSKNDDGKNIKMKCLDSPMDAKKSKAKKESGYKSDRILGSKKNNVKKFEKTNENQRLTKHGNITLTERNKLSAGYSPGPEMIDPYLWNKTETFSHDHPDSRHHHKSQPSYHYASHDKHYTQPENNSLSKYFRMWCPFIFGNEKSLTNTVQPANSCEHRSKCQTKMSTQISKNESLEKNKSTFTPEELSRRSAMGRKPSKEYDGKCDQCFRKSEKVREPSLLLERKRSQPIQKVKSWPSDFESEKEVLVRDMKEKPYDLVYWFKKEKMEQREALLNHKRRPLL